ncbi:hypothetical protein C8R46DRAFT_1201821 [Mycena filopes]|nr:hypothetical protein C8R46DRAFT_1201821 [Mycena filopes]
MSSSKAAPPQGQSLMGRTVQDECLHNLDLLDQIFCHLLAPLSRTSAINGGLAGVSSMRKAPHAAALTSRCFSHCAVPLLWRRLDNLLPLLRLLPSFYLNGRVYDLPGRIADTDWAGFDRHACFVQEVSSPDSPMVDPSVYIRLAMHKTPLLPNLRVFHCSEYGPEIVLYAPSALVTVALNLEPPAVGTFLSILSRGETSLTTLSLTEYASSDLSLCVRFQNLHSVTLNFAHGNIATTDFVTLGSIPLLQRLTSDIQQWEDIRFDSIAPGSLFNALTHLKIRGNCRQLHAHITALLDCIGAQFLTSLVVDTWRYPVTPHRALIFSPLSDAIRRRWTGSLQQLQISGLSCTGDEFAALPALPILRTLSLCDVLQGDLNDTRVLAQVRGWANITSLSIQKPRATLEFVDAVAQHCPALRMLHVSLLPPQLLPPSTTPLAFTHPLVELHFFAVTTPKAHWPLVDVPGLAQRFARMFPRLDSITGDGTEHRWKEVERVVFMFQEFRRA